MIAVRQLTSAAEVFANAAAVRARLYGAKPKSAPVEPAPIVSRSAYPGRSAPRKEPPMWSTQPMMFDEHVVAYRVMMSIASLDIAADETGQFPTRKSIPDIVYEVLASHPGITVADLKGPRRSTPIVRARMEAVYAVRMQRPDMSYPAIGRWFGGRDHTTVLHSVRKIDAAKGKA